MNTRNTNRQQEVLQLLSGDDFYQEVGAQPYAASSIAWLIDSSADQNQLTTSVRRTLQLLVKKGLVRAEKIPVEVQTGVSVANRNLDHYWNIATEKEDAVTAKAWNDGKKQRSDDALDKMFK